MREKVKDDFMVLVCVTGRMQWSFAEKGRAAGRSILEDSQEVRFG